MMGWKGWGGAEVGRLTSDHQLILLPSTKRLEEAEAEGGTEEEVVGGP